MGGKWERLLEALAQLYRDADRLTVQLQDIHSERIGCHRGCNSCCIDGITVYEIEAENIQRHHSHLLGKGSPHAEGACAFLDEKGGCRIYEHRPFACRTQGLPLRWLEEQEDGSVMEMRDICPLNENEQLIEKLPAEECWEIGPFEEKMASLQFAAEREKRGRIALRALFREAQGRTKQ
jgi:uncharacterized protein